MTMALAIVFAVLLLALDPVSGDTNITVGFISNYCAIKYLVFNGSLATNATPFYTPEVINVNGNSGWTYYSELAVLAAIDHANSNPSILPGVRVHLKRFTDCGEFYPEADAEYYGKSAGFAAAITATDIVDVHKDVLGVVGNEFSLTAKGIGQILSNAQIPYCATATSSSRFSDKNKYPYFWRVFANSRSQSLAALISYWKVKKVAIIYEKDDELGFAALRAMKTSLSERKINIVSITGLNPDLDTQAKEMMNTTLHRTDIRYILVLGQPYFVRSILLTREEMRLSGPRYVWVVNNGFITDPGFDRARLQGVIGPNVCQDTDLMERVRELQEDVSRRALFEIPISNFIEMSVQNIYDCTLMMLVGFSKLRVDPVALSRREFQDKMNFTLFQDLNYSGYSDFGKLTLNEEGNAQIPVCFASMTKVAGEDILFARTDKAANQIVQYDLSLRIFPGNSSIIPSDGLIEIFSFGYSLRNSEGIAIVCLSVVGLLASVAGALFLHKFQKSAIIRASCLPEMLLICFGCLCAYAALLLFVGIPTSTVCNSRIFLLLLGYASITIPLVCKNLMMRWLFGQESSRKIEAIRRAKAVHRFSGITAAFAYLAVSVLSIEQLKLAPVEVLDVNESYVMCAMKVSRLVAPTYVLYISTGILWVAVVVAAIMSTKVRLIEYNETNQMVLVALFSGIMFVLIKAMAAAPNRLSDFKVCVIIWITTTVILGTMLGGRVVDVMQHHFSEQHSYPTSAYDCHNSRQSSSALNFSPRKSIKMYSFRILDKGAKICVFKIKRRGIGRIFEKWMRGITSFHSLGSRKWICITTLQKSHCIVIDDATVMTCTSSSVEIQGSLKIKMQLDDDAACQLFLDDLRGAIKDVESRDDNWNMPDIVAGCI
ncbi:periplasmic binding protein-like I [Chytriomyces cf. hyalinus JEL632]|nr:periplasmic binding protein-like I [Chytriomyces cf. hyalinus JEL632]